MRSVMVLGVVAVAGCAASQARLQSVSSGHVGCPPADVQVSAYKLGAFTSSWTATCRNQAFLCSGDDMLRGVSCTPAK
jgi:hypothetical protein